MESPLEQQAACISDITRMFSSVHQHITLLNRYTVQQHAVQTWIHWACHNIARRPWDVARARPRLDIARSQDVDAVALPKPA